MMSEKWFRSAALSFLAIGLLGVAGSAVQAAASGKGKRNAEAAAAFGQSCAMCHGKNGQGMVGPQIRPLRVGVAEARMIVRRGRGEMPAIPVSQLPNAKLEMILVDLRTGP